MTARRLAAVTLLATAAAAAPASAPATGDPVSLGNDLVRFFAPPGPDWSLKPTQNPNPNQVYFQTADAKSALLVQLTPPDQKMDAATANPMATAIVKKLIEMRKQAGHELILSPKVERDRRLDIVIHEKFKMGTTVVEQIHIYKGTGPRTVMAEASTVLTDPAAVTAVFNTAKTAVASAKYNRKAKP